TPTLNCLLSSIKNCSLASSKALVKAVSVEWVVKQGAFVSNKGGFVNNKAALALVKVLVEWAVKQELLAVKPVNKLGRHALLTHGLLPTCAPIPCSFKQKKKSIKPFAACFVNSTKSASGSLSKLSSGKYQATTTSLWPQNSP